MITTENCWYKGACTAECTPACIRFLEMTYLVEQSNLPESRWFPETLYPELCDYDAFCELSEIKDNITDFVSKGSSLYLFSENTGNGKTSWAIKILLKYFDLVWAGNGFRTRGLFVNIPTFLAALKNFDKKSTKFETLKEVLPTVDLVIWDDIASTVLSNYDYSQLITYIDQRLINKKSNIYTGNLSQSGIEQALGARLASRVWNASYKIELKGKDNRKW